MFPSALHVLLYLWSICCTQDHPSLCSSFQWKIAGNYFLPVIINWIYTHTFNFFMSARSLCNVLICLSCWDLSLMSLLCSRLAFCRRSFSADSLLNLISNSLRIFSAFSLVLVSVKDPARIKWHHMTVIKRPYLFHIYKIIQLIHMKQAHVQIRLQGLQQRKQCFLNVVKPQHWSSTTTSPSN